MPFKDEATVPGVPNYTPAQMRRWALVVSSMMTFLAVTSILLRLISRRIRLQKLWLDDYLIMFSMVWNWVVVAIALAMYAEGEGYHADTLGPEKVARIARLLLVSEVIYIWHMCWTKLSVLLMYYRIFHFPVFKMLVIGVGSFVVMWAVAATFLFTFICVPTEKLWNPSLPGHCISEMGVWVANASSTIFSDIAILILPIPQVWKLNTRTSEKIGLTFVFGLGFFTVFTSAYRISVLFNYSREDASYTLFPLLVWTDIEMCAAVISACLPTMRPVMQFVGIKLGITRPSQASASTSNPSGGGSLSRKRTRSTSGRAMDPNSMISRTSEEERYYRANEETEMDEVLVHRAPTRQPSTADSKHSWYPPSTIDTDAKREEVVTRGSIV